MRPPASLRAGRLRSLIDITYPVLRPAAFIAWLLIFPPLPSPFACAEQPMSAILTQSETEVMSTRVLQFIENGSIEVAAAISVLIVVVSMVTIGVARLSPHARSSRCIEAVRNGQNWTRTIDKKERAA
jgi:iron(III) transport system permease protein